MPHGGDHLSSLIQIPKFSELKRWGQVFNFDIFRSPSLTNLLAAE
jgi:hypothetical protein